MNRFNVTRLWLEEIEQHDCPHRSIVVDYNYLDDTIVGYACKCGWKATIRLKDLLETLRPLHPCLREMLVTDTGKWMLADILSHPGVVSVDYEREYPWEN